MDNLELARGPAIDAVVFDFDGLILDTEGPEFQSWQEIYRAYGRELPLATYAVAIGTLNAFDPISELERQLGVPLDREAIRQERRRRNRELLAREPIRPGVKTYLDDARRLGIKLGVASSSPREWVAGHLERLGLIDAFGCVKSADDVARVKPEPELYFSALGALNADPARAIALEDSPNGILAAKRAGMFCVAVPNQLTRQLPLDRADLRLDSLAELPLAGLIARLPVARPPYLSTRTFE